MPACVIEMQGNQKAFGWTKKIPLLIGEREWLCFLPRGPFPVPRQKHSLPVYFIGTRNACPSLSLLSCPSLFSTHIKLTSMFVDFPSSPLHTRQPSCFLLLSAFSLRSRLHFSKTKIAFFTLSSNATVACLCHFFGSNVPPCRHSLLGRTNSLGRPKCPMNM